LIKKFLVCGKQVTLTGHKAELEREGVYICEVLMPLETYWKAEKFLKEAEYLTSTDEDPSAIQEVILNVYRTVVPFVISEKDRIWLYEKIQQQE
jgi:hypothetical protein